ncbi:MAG TPA: copper chaperone PCu(A)C, partial [Burkholderiaceae bacterium]
APAQSVKVSEAWVRATVAQQKVSGAFMHLQAAGAMRLVAASTPAAERVEIHTMSMDGDRMRMREIEGVELPAGAPVALQPGGRHLMLMGLKKPLQAGTRLPLTLTFVGADGKRQTLSVDAEVRALGAPGAQ